MPKARITREMVVDAAFAVARAAGAEKISARTVSEQLDCSTQPVMYHFARIEELKRAAYERANQFHSEYLLRIQDPEKNAFLEIGLNYIRFAVQEPQLFRFLFQSGFAAENDLLEMIDSPELRPIFLVMREALGISPEQVREVFLTTAMFTHGCASIIANNGLAFDEETAAAYLERACQGAVLAAREEKK